MKTDKNGKRIYGDWAGNLHGVLEDETCCIKEVWPQTGQGGWIPYQCHRKRGHGLSSLYCKQHAKMHNKIRGVTP